MPVKTIAAFTLLALVLYGGFKAAPMLLGPTLTLTSPFDGATIQDGILSISGIAHHTEKLSLDGAPLLIDQNGAFTTSLVLPQGSAILTLTVSDRFGRSHSVTRTVYVP